MKDSLTQKLLCMFLCFLLILGNLPINIYADDGFPTITVTPEGSTSIGPIFKGQSPLYPGCPEISNTLRIKNALGENLKLDRIGMNISLIRKNEPLTMDNWDAADFMKYMKIRVKYKNPITNLFQGTIYDGSFAGFSEGVSCSISINNNNTMDLVYYVSMDEDAESNTAGITARINFTVGVEGLGTGDGDTGDNGDDNNNDDNDGGTSGRQLIEEPVDIIPDIGGHWAHDCIVTLINYEIIDREPGSSIRPDDYITRAEAAVLIGRALKLKPSKDISTGYVDVIPTWARGYIIATSKAGVFKGYPGRKFKPNINISREELTAVLIRAFRKDSMSDKEMAFKDSDKIAKWARGYVAAAVEESIIVGNPDNTFNPKGFMTRAQAFTIVCKLLGLHAEHSKLNKD